MHPKISEFPSNTFYNGLLQNGVSIKDRSDFTVKLNWLNKEKPTMFINCKGEDQLSSQGQSRINYSEYHLVKQIINSLLNACKIILLK